MKRGEIYRTVERLPVRGDKPGFYVVVSRQYVVDHDRLSTVVCAPIYSEFEGLPTELVVGHNEGLPHMSSIRCDFLTLLFKRRLTTLVGRLSEVKMAELDGALRRALELD